MRLRRSSGWGIASPAVLALVAAALLLSCGDGEPGPAATSTAIGAHDSASMTGGGATFPAPVYQAWFDDYHRYVAPGVQINYQSIGSGGGIQQFAEGTVDFGASDVPMTEEQLDRTPDAVHIPMVLGAVVVTYNLPGVDDTLRLDGPTIADIYLGRIKQWSDPAIAALNPDVALPDKDIQVVYRSDGSGTSFVWTDYLSHVSEEWQRRAGASKNPNWPVGQGGKGNEGVTNAVKQTPNAIGYVERNYAVANRLPYADIENRAGNFVTPTLESTSAAAAGVTMPPDYRVSIVDADGAQAYPIASFTYLLVHQDTSSCKKQRPLVHMLWWVFHDPNAKQTAEELNYATIPEALLPRVEDTLRSLKCDGRQILPDA